MHLGCGSRLNGTFADLVGGAVTLTLFDRFAASKRNRLAQMQAVLEHPPAVPEDLLAVWTNGVRRRKIYASGNTLFSPSSS